MPTVAVGVEYNGEHFHGSQKQRDLRTVQAVLEKALSAVADESISLTFAGRTDAGVHATNQIASFTTQACRPPSAWIHGTNSHLPKDVAIHSVFEVDSTFDARRSALRRRYLYVFGLCDVVPAFGVNEAHWVKHPMDAEQLNELTSLFLGEQDFSSVCAANDTSESRFRDVQRFLVHSKGPYTVLDITANAFLLRMVRNIAGCFLAVARGEISKQDVECVLAAKDRSAAPATAIAAGLYLVHVEYDQLGTDNRLRVPQILGPGFDGLLETNQELQVTYQRPSRLSPQRKSM